MPTPEVCPNCGADVPPRAKSCPDCGSDEQTGWSEAAASDGLNLPDEEFKYEEFVEREFGADSPRPRHIPLLWWVVGLLALLGFLIMVLH